MAGDGSSATGTSHSSRPGGNNSSQRGRGSKPFRGGRGGRGGGNSFGKKRDMGRSEWSKTKPDKRAANTENQTSKRQKLNDGEAAPLPVYATQFDAEDIAAEGRRPKRKVAVLIGYSGTGYRGMQLAPDQKTIEGDLFKAFVAAGAISKANADDPKKSSFVRCARTDKGVHAAGNIISLKLIVEDEGIVQKINDNLTPQIRVWGFERTNNSFSSYQLCDSRIYEYLIPTHSFLPPHPRSFLAKQCHGWAEKKGDLEQWQSRQEEVKGYWEAVDEEMIKPILDDYDQDVRDVLQKALWLNAEQDASKQSKSESTSKKPGSNKATASASADTEDTDIRKQDKEVKHNGTTSNGEISKAPALDVVMEDNQESATGTVDAVEPEIEQIQEITDREAQPADTQSGDTKPELTEEQRAAREARIARRKLIEEGVKRLRAAYVAAKRKYRIPESRKQRVQETLNLYTGTNNHWNFTVDKQFKDPSAKRVIKTFKVNPTPILIDGTEWLSLKVHGQSFMMHQIRKLVGMAALIVRCGCDPNRIRDAYGSIKISVPKAPSLGLLLERPVFDSYNKRAKSELNKEPISFDQYTTEMDVFKQKFIYERMYEDEERDNVFGNFFNHIDNYPSNTFLFVTSGGIEASQVPDGPDTGATQPVSKDDAEDSEDENDEGVKLDVVDSDDELDAVKDNAGDEG